MLPFSSKHEYRTDKIEHANIAEIQSPSAEIPRNWISFIQDVFARAVVTATRHTRYGKYLTEVRRPNVISAGVRSTLFHPWTRRSHRRCLRGASQRDRRSHRGKRRKRAPASFPGQSQTRVEQEISAGMEWREADRVKEREGGSRRGNTQTDRFL